MSPTVREPPPASPSSRRSSSVTPCQPLRRTQASASAAVANRSGDAGGARVGRRVRLRRAQAQVVRLRRGEPQRAGDRVAHPHELADHARRHHAEVAAERDELAQLVLREHRVRLALRVLEDPAALGGGDRRRPAACGRRHRSGSARASWPAVGQHRPHEEEARGRARVLVAARPLPEPEREAAARDERPRRAHARSARRPRHRASAVPRSSPSRAAAATASAAGRSAS